MKLFYSKSKKIASSKMGNYSSNLTLLTWIDMANLILIKIFCRNEFSIETHFYIHSSIEGTDFFAARQKKILVSNDTRFLSTNQIELINEYWHKNKYDWKLNTNWLIRLCIASFSNASREKKVIKSRETKQSRIWQRNFVCDFVFQSRYDLMVYINNLFVGQKKWKIRDMQAIAYIVS